MAAADTVFTPDPDVFATAVRDPDLLPTAMAYMQRLREKKNQNG